MRDLLKYSIKALTTLVFAIIVGACQTTPTSYIKNVASGGALGTSYSITFLSSNEFNMDTEIDSVFEVINNSMSTYLASSDISRINSGDSTVVVDNLFRDVFVLADKVYKETNGYFDPTVGSLVNAWGFGPGVSIPMDSTKVDSLLQITGFNKVELLDNGRIVKKDPRIYLDFNAIAKGYAIDQIANLMEVSQIENYLIEVGGEIVAKGTNKIKQKPWVVGIDDPQIEQGRRLKITLQLKDKAMASSGNYRKYRIDSLTGEKYVHTVDPKTGYTKNGKILASSVISNTCAEADAYATAFMAMSLEQSKEVIKNNRELEVYIIYLTNENTVAEYMTGGFKKLILP